MGMPLILENELAFLKLAGATKASRLHSEQSEFQKIDIIDTDRYGRVLMLDGVVQTATADECFYHEMLVHVPIYAMASAKNILIVGGGDGGSLREVLKHPQVEKVTMVEIDERVVDVCCDYLPHLNRGGKVFDDPRAELIIADAVQFMHRRKSEERLFDVVIIDSTDQQGLAESLFTTEFYHDCVRLMNPNGVLVIQSEAPSKERQPIRKTLANLRAHFQNAGCFIVSIPSYVCGYSTFAWASPNLNLKTQTKEELQQNWDQDPIETYIYNVNFHLATFALPNWIEYLTEPSPKTNNS
jgi:spermidine synthase